MKLILDFIVNNYVWILTITIILLFALIGYIYDSKKNENDHLKKAESEIEEQVLNANNEEPLVNLINNNEDTSTNIEEINNSNNDIINN